MKRIALFTLALSALTLIACTNVTTRRPVGETPAKLDKARWNGAWQTNDGHLIYTRVKDADKGILETLMVNVNDQQIELQRVDVRFVKAGTWLWVGYHEKENTPYVFARVNEPDDDFLAWTPRSEPFKELVRSGVLKGVIEKDEKGKEKDSLVLDSLSDADLKAIEEGKFGKVFDWAKPALVLRRLKK